MADMDLSQLEQQLNEVEAKLEDLKARWPAHSLKPAMLAELEDLEEERDKLKALVEQHRG